MALENVQGVHYWAIDTWGGNNKVMGVEQINGTMLTTFDVWSAQEQVNGDGILIYPPQNPLQGPLSSIRLENIRDGIEDFELFHAVGIARCRDLISKAITNGTHYTLDVELLESLRRDCARRAVLGKAKTDDRTSRRTRGED